MIIYMRHGNDEQSHPRYRNDPGIRHGSRDKIRDHSHKLIQKYGYPDIVYVSPMARGIETVQEMELPSQTQIRVLPELSRFFLKSEIDFKKIDPMTLKRGLPLFENPNQFKKRSDLIVKWLDQTHQGLTVWCITHALVLKRAARYYQAHLSNHQDFLEWFPAKISH